MASGHILIISVNTPPKADEPQALQNSSLKQEVPLGRATDMRAFTSVVKAISKSCLQILNNEDFIHKIIVEKSTVPLGTAQAIRKSMESDL